VAKDGKKKDKLPKEIGGVKVPKKLRKIGNKAVKLAKEPVVSEVVAGALLAAAAALREGGGGKQSAAGDAVEGAKRQAGRLGDSLKVIAIDLARRALDNLEEGGRRKGGSGDGGAGG
jgi:hypothetical protein